MTEIWKDIDEYKGIYQISNLGRIKHLGRPSTDKKKRISYVNERFLVPQHYPNGYCFVMLSNNGKSRAYSLHRLVLIAFCGNKSGYEVNHKDENKDNNCLDNLEWVTHKDNCNYGTRNIRSGEKQDNHGSKNPMYGKFGHSKKSIKVALYDINGNYIKSYPSMGFAAKDNNLAKASVRNAIHFRHGLMPKRKLIWKIINNIL